VGTVLKGLFGDLLIKADGTYTYVVDNNNLTVERLNVGDQLAESFNYTVLDHPGGLIDTAVLTLTIEGTNDNPLASDDFIGRLTSGQPGTIRVIANDTDIDSKLVPSTIQIVGTAAAGDPLVIPGQGTWSVNPGTGDITFTPPNGAVASLGSASDVAVSSATVASSARASAEHCMRVAASTAAHAASRF
jgi:VCBS repeat-containing protein